MSHDVGTVALVLGDDLTGANDTAVQFARAGWDSQLILNGSGLEPGATPVAYAATADDRALDPATALSAVTSTVERLGVGAIDLLYLKVDSTMRGPVASHIAGAMEVWRRSHPGAIAILCPAYPAMGRTVADGVLLVNGVPVCETGIGNDPVSPVRESRLDRLVPGALPLQQPGEDVGNAVARALAEGGGVYVADARTGDDLVELAAAVCEHPGGQVVPVGSAGLALELSRRWADECGVSPSSAADLVPPAPVAGPQLLVQVSSLNQVSRAQLAALLETAPGDTTLVLAPDLATVAGAGLEQWIATRTGDLAGIELVVLVAPEDRTGTPDADLSLRIATNMGQASAALAQRTGIPALGLVGGDGARATLAALDVTRLRVVGALEEGMPLGILLDGALPGTAVFTKAGGFGTASSLVDAAARILRQPERRIS